MSVDLRVGRGKTSLVLRVPCPFAETAETSDAQAQALTATVRRYTTKRKGLDTCGTVRKRARDTDRSYDSCNGDCDLSAFIGLCELLVLEKPPPPGGPRVSQPSQPVVLVCDLANFPSDSADPPTSMWWVSGAQSAAWYGVVVRFRDREDSGGRLVLDAQTVGVEVCDHLGSPVHSCIALHNGALIVTLPARAVSAEAASASTGLTPPHGRALSSTYLFLGDSSTDAVYRELHRVWARRRWIAVLASVLPQDLCVLCGSFATLRISWLVSPRVRDATRDRFGAAGGITDVTARHRVFV